LLSDKPREVVNAESVMQSQAWTGGINTVSPATSSADNIGSSHQLLQSQTTTLLAQPRDARSASAWLHPVIRTPVHPSVAMLKTASLTIASSLPHILSADNTEAERTLVENVLNPQHLSRVVADSLTLGTPVKRVDSISASAANLKASAVDGVSVKNLPRTHRLHYESNKGDGRGRETDVAGSQYTKQTGGKSGLRPQVRSIVDRRSDEASKLQGAVSADFRNVQQQQQQTRDVVDVHASLHSATLKHQAVGQANVNAKIFSSSLLAETVSSQSSTAEYVTATDLPVDAGHIKSSGATTDGSFSSYTNTRLNELWNRFSQDYTVCHPHAIDCGTGFTASSIDQTDTGVLHSSPPQSNYQHSEQSCDFQAAGDTAQHATNQQQQYSSDERQTRNIVGHSSSAAGFTTNALHAGYHTVSSDSNDISQRVKEPLHSLHEAHSNVEDKSKSQKPSKSGDTGKVSLLSTAIPSKHAWIIKDQILPVVPEDTTLDSVSSDFTSASSVDDTGNIIRCTITRHLPNDPKLLRLQQKIAQQREKHRIVHGNEQRRKEHIVKMELALKERQKEIEQRMYDVQKTGDDHPSLSQSEITESSTLLTTVTSDSDMTSSLLRPSADSSQLTSASCPCQQAWNRKQRVIHVKENDAFPQKHHKSETTFRPELREVKYTKAKATKSAPSLLSRENISCELERNTGTKNVKRKVISSSASHRTQSAQTAGLKNAQGDQRSHSKIIKSSKINKPSSQSKASYSNRILTEKNKLVTKEHGMQSKAVQTTPRLRDNRVLYASTAIQCPTDSSQFDDLDVVSRHVVSRAQHTRSLSSKIFLPDSSSDAELLQHIKYKSLAKRPTKVPLPRELFAYY